MQFERTDVIPSVLHQKVLAAVRQLITNEGRQSFPWSLGRATYRKVDADGCNWTIYLNASADLIRIAQPAIDDIKRRFNLKVPHKRGRPSSPELE